MSSFLLIKYDMCMSLEINSDIEKYLKSNALLYNYTTSGLYLYSTDLRSASFYS